MDNSQLQTSIEFQQTVEVEESATPFVSLETEMPEVLYNEMKEFILNNPKWDQYQIISSALASFLFQNGCSDRAVTEKYLNDLFKISCH